MKNNHIRHRADCIKCEKQFTADIKICSFCGAETVYKKRYFIKFYKG